MGHDNFLDGHKFDNKKNERDNKDKVERGSFEFQSILPVVIVIIFIIMFMRRQ